MSVRRRKQVKKNSLKCYMCKLMEDRVKDNRLMEKVQIALKLLSRGKDSLEEIADIIGLSLKDIKDLSERVNAPA